MSPWQAVPLDFLKQRAASAATLHAGIGLWPLSCLVHVMMPTSNKRMSPPPLAYIGIWSAS